MHHCKNCEEHFTGQYCGICGQKANIGRLHMHDLWHEVWHAFTHADRGILKLINDLVLHPTIVYVNYFKGQRKFYFNPVLFYLLTAGVAIYLGDKIFAYENHINNMNNEYGKFVLDHTKLLGIFILPLEALLTWGIFRKRYNLAEYIVFWLLCNGLIFTFKIVITPFYLPLIQYKKQLDYWVGMVGYAIIFWQLIAVFAWKQKWSVYVLCFFLANFTIILYQYAGYYLLFDNKTFQQPIWEMIVEAYT